MRVIFYLVFIFIFGTFALQKSPNQIDYEEKLKLYEAELKNNDELNEVQKVLKLKEMMKYYQVENEIKIQKLVESIENENKDKFFAGGHFVRYLAFGCIAVLVGIVFIITIRKNPENKDD